MKQRIVHYRCRECDSVFALAVPGEKQLRDTKHECGGKAVWFHVTYGDLPEPDTAPMAFVKNRPYQFDPRHRVMPQGRHYGISDAVYGRGIRETVKRETDRQREIDRSHARGKADVPRLIGMMSMEKMHSIALQEGDPTVMQKDPETFLKKTGDYIER